MQSPLDRRLRGRVGDGGESGASFTSKGRDGSCGSGEEGGVRLVRGGDKGGFGRSEERGDKSDIFKADKKKEYFQGREALETRTDKCSSFPELVTTKVEVCSLRLRLLQKKRSFFPNGATPWQSPPNRLRFPAVVSSVHP